MSSNIRTIVTHKNCVDGFISGLILKEAYPDAEVVALSYETPEHRELEAAPHMIFCDMTPPLARAAEFFAQGAIVLDHHKSARAIFDLPNLTPESVYSSVPGVSGAVLALAHAKLRYASLSLDNIVALVGTYDTWRTASPLWTRACCAHAVLDLILDVSKGAGPEADSVSDLRYITSHWDELLMFGRLLFARTEAQAKHLADEAMFVSVVAGSGSDMRVALLPPAKHGAALVNRAASHLETRADLTVAGVDWKPRTVSLRSRGDVDCSAIAAALGGGGHAGAAGFTLPREADAEAALRIAVFDTVGMAAAEEKNL